MTERGHAYALRSAMTKTPRNPPSSTGPRPPAAAPHPDAAGSPPGETPGASNPFASLASSSFDEPGGATKLYEVPRELIEIARARAAEPKASTGTLTPIAPRPNAELEATLAAYTAGLAGTASSRPPSAQPVRGEPAPRQEVSTPRSQPPLAYEESGTVLRRDAPRPPEAPQRRAAQSERAPPARPAASERLPALERKPVLRSPVSPSSKPAARPRSAPAGAAPARGQPWALYLALCVILGYCVHLLLSS